MSIQPAKTDCQPVSSAKDIYNTDALLMEWHSKGITHEDIVMTSFYLTEIRTNPPIVIGMLVGKVHAENQHCPGVCVSSDQTWARLRADL